MSPKLPRSVFGADLAKAMCASFAYRLRGQTGSHIVVELANGSAGHISIPAHRPLKVGMLGAILRLFEEQTGLKREDLLKRL